MSRFYANENVPQTVVEALRELGHDVLTTREAGQANQAIPDADVLRFAIGEKRAVLTSNRRHFVQLHAQDSAHAGIVVCTFGRDFAVQAHRIHEAISTAETLEAQLLRVNRPPG